MTPQEHYLEAERLLTNLKELSKQIADTVDEERPRRARMLDMAVLLSERASGHALLAQVDPSRTPD